MKKKSMLDEKGEVPELTAEDMKAFRPAREVLPQSLQLKLGIRGPQKAPTKELVSLRVSRVVLEAFRASGKGWQTKIDEALKEYVGAHKLS